MKENLLDKLYKIEKEYYIQLPINTRKAMYLGKNYFGRLSELITKNIDIFCDFSLCDSNEGVYLLGDFYIGMSINIKRRLGEHLEEALVDSKKLKSGIKYPKSYNKEKIEKLRDYLIKGKINITLLSENMLDEYNLIVEGRSKYNLTNKTGNSKNSSPPKKGKLVEEKLYPIYFKGKYWKKEECHDVFTAFYHTKHALDWQISVYVSEGDRIQPDGTWVN